MTRNSKIVFQPLAVGPEVAASLTGTTRSIIYHAIAVGELKAFKAGRRRLILIKELEAWITLVAARSVSDLDVSDTTAVGLTGDRVMSGC